MWPFLKQFPASFAMKASGSRTKCSVQISCGVSHGPQRFNHYIDLIPVLLAHCSSDWSSAMGLGRYERLKAQAEPAAAWIYKISVVALMLPSLVFGCASGFLAKANLSSAFRDIRCALRAFTEASPPSAAYPARACTSDQMCERVPLPGQRKTPRS